MAISMAEETALKGVEDIIFCLSSRVSALSSSHLSFRNDAMTRNLSFSLDWIKVKRQESVSVHVCLCRDLEHCSLLCEGTEIELTR